MAFCIFHQHCPTTRGDNGNCSVYPPIGVKAVNTHRRPCGHLNTEIYTFEKKRKLNKRNPLKQSKKGG